MSLSPPLSPKARIRFSSSSFSSLLCFHDVFHPRYEIIHTKETERFFGVIPFDKLTGLFFAGRIPVSLYVNLLERERPPNFVNIYVAYFAQRFRDAIPIGNYADHDKKASQIIQTLSLMLDFPMVATFKDEQHLMVFVDLSEELRKSLSLFPALFKQSEMDIIARKEKEKETPKQRSLPQVYLKVCHLF